MEENLDTQVEQQEQQEPQTTADVVAAEFDKLEKAQEEETSPAIRTRDESGKFSKKEVNQEEKSAQDQAEHQEQQEQKPSRNPYSSWKKEAQEKLSALPTDVQQMIQERESQFHKGIQSYKEDATYGRTLKQAIGQYDPYFQELGTDAQQAIPMLLNAEITLRKGSPEQKTQMLMQLAHDYGIDVNTLAQTQFNPVEFQLRQQLANLQNQVAGISQSRQMAEEANLSQTIEQFADGHEHFEELRNDMADLFEKGVVDNMEDAYKLALRQNDGVFQKWLANQQSTQDRQRLEQANQAAKAAKASAVSVKGSPSGTTRPPEPKTTEEAVRQAMAAMGL